MDLRDMTNEQAAALLLEKSPPCVESLVRFVQHGTRLNGFMHALMCNDLRRVIMTGDDINIPLLTAWVNVVSHVVHHSCWGSYAVVGAWEDYRCRTSEAGLLAMRISMRQMPDAWSAVVQKVMRDHTHLSR